MGRGRLLLGITIFWLALSLLFDGMNSLLLPYHLTGFTDEATRATTLGLLTFVGLLAGMFIQPVAAAWSDRLRPRWGRRGVLALGTALLLLALFAFSASRTIFTIFLAYTFVQLALNVAQAAQQGFIPDLVPPRWRGAAAGLKGFMDVGGALLAFAFFGSLLEEGAFSTALLLIAVVLLIALAGTVLLVREPHTQGVVPERLTLRQTFHVDPTQHQAFLALVLSRFLFLLGTYGVGRFFLYFVAERLNLAPANAAADAGTVLAGLTLITVVAAPPTGWAADRIGRLPLMLFGAGVNAVGLLLLTIAAQQWQLLLFGGLMALGSAAFAGANWAMTADLAPPGEGARFMALANFGTAGAAAAAGLFGVLVDGANALLPGSGYPALLVVAALTSIASALALRPLFLSRAQRLSSVAALQNE